MSICISFRKRIERILVLRVQAEGDATRREHLHRRPRLQQHGDVRGRVEHMLEVVEEQERVPPCEILESAHPNSLEDCRPDEVSRCQRGEADEENAPGEVVEHLGADLHREPRLSAAALQR